MAINISERTTSTQQNFGTTGTINNGSGRNQFNIPKAKYNFIVHFELTTKAKALIADMHGGDIALGSLTSFVIKDMGKPNFSMATDTYNQYNRTRLAPGKITYDPMSMVLYDTVNSAALLLIDAYRKFYYGDFSDKSLTSWQYDTISTPSQFEDKNTLVNGEARAVKDYTWGRSVFNMGDRDEGYFFKRIDIYEIDGSVYTVHNIHHPVLESVQFDEKSHESEGEPATISLSMKHEGTSNICPITNKKAIANSTAELSSLLFGNGEFSPLGFYKSFGELDESLSSIPDANISKRYPSGAQPDVTSLIDFFTGGLLTSTTINVQRAISTGRDAVVDGGRSVIKSIGGLF